MKRIKLSTITLLFLSMNVSLHAEKSSMWDMFSSPMEQMDKIKDMMPEMEKITDIMPIDNIPIIDEMMDEMKDKTGTKSTMSDAASDMSKSASVTDEELQKLAEEDIAKMDKDNDIVSDQYHIDLQNVMKKIKLPSGIKLDVKVYWSPYLYIFSRSNGAIRVNHGIIEKLNDNELLFVMAHEVGHLLHEDFKKSYRKEHAMYSFEKMLNMGGESMGSMSNGVLSSVTSEMRKSRFQKHEEFNADEYAMAVLKANNIPRDAAVDALELLQYLDAPLLKMHPTGHERVKNIEDNYAKDCTKL
ncbi:MAG: Metalloprotease [uncultured Sulfurovum sp.]|uniref:Metalloprotease n=1 Tax=uncultured Sulfurovum sp. TaxID=269237 RepID=A0A6S6T3D9_9BACT|nr:MAG: Metalloprotease [uncultured Sulfurovum sp.]